MIKNADAGVAGRGFFGQHHVEPVRCQLSQQIFRLAIAANQMNGAFRQKKRAQDLVGDEPGKRIREAHPHPQRPRGGAGSKFIQQFAAEQKDIVRIALHQLPCFCQDVIPSLPAEERLPHRRLQLPDLPGDGGLGDIQHCRGPRQAALAGDGPEVSQMVVVEPFHGLALVREIRTVHS